MKKGDKVRIKEIYPEGFEDPDQIEFLLKLKNDKVIGTIKSGDMHIGLGRLEEINFYVIDFENGTLCMLPEYELELVEKEKEDDDSQFEDDFDETNEEMDFSGYEVYTNKFNVGDTVIVIKMVDYNVGYDNLVGKIGKIKSVNKRTDDSFYYTVKFNEDISIINNNPGKNEWYAVENELDFFNDDDDDSQFEDDFENENIIYTNMKYLKSYKLFEASQSNSYSVGDIVNINYWATNEPTPVVIKNIKSDGNGRKIYTVSHDLRSKQDMLRNIPLNTNLFNAPDQTITNKDIINTVISIQTPIGPGFVSTVPTMTGSPQVTNDMYV